MRKRILAAALSVALLVSPLLAGCSASASAQDAPSTQNMPSCCG